MRRLMWFTIGFTASCVMGVYLFSGLRLGLFALSGLLTAVALCFLKSKTGKATVLLLFGFAAGMVWQWGYDAFYLQTARQYDGQSVNASVEISDYSYDTDYGMAADGKILLENKIFRVRVYLDSMDKLSPGDTVRGNFHLRLTAQGGDREATYHQGKGIFLLGYEDGEVTVTNAPKVPVKYFAAKLRQEILYTLDTVFPADTVAFARALLLGDSTKLTYEEDTAFKISGIRHVIAVSGLHVSILFALVYMVSGKHRVLTAALGIPVLLLFAAVAGFTPSIVRACIMQGLMILAMLLKKEYDPPTALSFAVLTMLAVNPLTITSVSFQLSVGCMVGIFLFCQRISGYLTRLIGTPKGNTLRGRLTRWLVGSVSVTVSAMALTTPLSALYFGTVSLVGILTNLVTLWVISFVFYGIMLACLVGAVWLPVGKLIAAAVSLPMRYVLWMAKTLASVPLAAVYTCSVYILAWLVLSYVLLTAFLIIKKKQPLLFAVCVSVGLCVALAASYIEPRLDALRVTVMDVGQGQSVLLQSDGKYYLVDCGGDDPESAADTVSQQLLSQGVTHLDGLFLTHYDADHAGGAAYLMSRIAVNKLYLPDVSDDSNTKKALTGRYNDKIQWVREATKLSGTWGALTAIPGDPQKDENESGLCILFQAENCDILITGDRNSSGEKALLESVDLPALELLVVGHHGSRSSTCFELLSTVVPKAAVISVGEDNAYGHPADEVLERLNMFGCQIWRTDLDGTVIFRR